MSAEGAQLLGAMEGRGPMTALEKRKRFRQLGRASPRLRWSVDPRQASGAAMPSGRFEATSDEVIVLVLEHLAALPTKPLCGLELLKAVRRTVDDLAAFTCTCRRVNTVLCAIAPTLRKELVARATTQIAPRGLDFARWNDNDDQAAVGARPYTAQVEAETRSADQLALLRVAVDGMATHCGMAHCRPHRQALNRDLRRRALPVPRPAFVRSISDEKTHAVAATATGDRVFVAVRRVIPKDVVSRLPPHQRDALEAMRTRTAIDVLIRCCVNAEGIVVRPSSEIMLSAIHEEGRYGPIEHLAADSTGEWVAVLRSLTFDGPPDHAVWDEDERPQTELVLWRADADTTSCVLEPPPATAARGLVHAQSAWWMRRSVTAPGDVASDALVVLWSSTWVHEDGLWPALDPTGAAYALVTYRIDPPVADDPDYPGEPPEAFVAHIESEVESHGFDGLALQASASAHGDSVAILVFQDVALVKNRRTVYMHDIGAERRQHLESHMGLVGAAAQGAKIVATGFAPGGDAVVVAYRCPHGVYLEVLERTGGVRSEPVFVSTHTINITPHVWAGCPEPALFRDGSGVSDAPAPVLRQPFAIAFSPCGRFAVVVDQRPKWQLSITNHALVVIDMAMRHMRGGVRARPLASVDDVAPRSLQWTERGLCLMARHGALLLWAP